MTGSLCYCWQNLHIIAVSTLPRSRPLFMHSTVFIPVTTQLLQWLSRGFLPRTPLSSCSICICFFKSSWKKQRLLTKTMQIVIGDQHWTLWLGAMFGCPVNMFVLCILLLSWTTVTWACIKSSCVSSAPSMRSQYSPIVHVSLLKPVHPDPFQWQSLPPSPVMVQGQREYHVWAILDSRISWGTLQYLIDWVGHGPEVPGRPLSC